MKKFTVTYEFASYISEEIESADMDEACEKACNQKYNEVKNKYLPKINLKKIEISVKEITGNETNEIAAFY